jgi:hypothetical protein
MSTGKLQGIEQPPQVIQVLTASHWKAEPVGEPIHLKKEMIPEGGGSSGGGSGRSYVSVAQQTKEREEVILKHFSSFLQLGEFKTIPELMAWMAEEAREDKVIDHFALDFKILELLLN